MTDEVIMNDDIHNEECNICMTRGVNNIIKCHICNVKICTICCNFMKNFKYDRDLKESDGCGICATYTCPFCKCKDIEIPFSKLNKEDLLQFIKIDYIRFIKLGNQNNRLKEIYDKKVCQLMKVEYLKNKNNDNETIDYLIEEYNKLKDFGESVSKILKTNYSLNDELIMIKEKNLDNENRIKIMKDEYKSIIHNNNNTIINICNDINLKPSQKIKSILKFINI